MGLSSMVVTVLLLCPCRRRKAADGRMPLTAVTEDGLWGVASGGERTTTALRAGYSIVGKVGDRSVAASEFNGFRVPGRVEIVKGK